MSPNYRGVEALRSPEAWASSASVRTPSYRLPDTIQVGYFLTAARSQRPGSAAIPFGSHSTYGRSAAAGPNRAFCSVHAGHQKAP